MQCCDSLLSFLHKLKTIHHLNQIHSFLITSGFSNHPFLLTDLLHCFLNPHHHSDTSLSHASLLFNQIQNPTINLWNATIRCFSTSSQPQTSFTFYARMIRNRVLPDKHTFPLLLKAFSRTEYGNPFQFHAHIVKFGFDSDDFIRNSLISAFSSCGYVSIARKLFDGSSQKDIVAWTAMIDGYVKNDLAVESLLCFMGMRSVGINIDEMTIVSVLRAVGMAGYLQFGKCLQGLYIEQGRVKFDLYVGSALIDMYTKCSSCDDALKIFDLMPTKNVVVWTTLIAGYVHCGRFNDALSMFENMLKEDVIKPNQSTLTSVLVACSQLGTLDRGRWIHRYIDKFIESDINSNLGTAVVDMYARCGSLDEALMAFEKLSRKNVYTWTAMINGFSMHGDAISSLNMFSKMLSNGVCPNEVTFIAVLSACAHGGLVNEGRKMFKSMKEVYNLEPNVDHYGCMVDLLGRAGYLNEAMKVINEMPMEPHTGVWGALFGACMIHKDFELGEIVGKRLIELQPDHSGRYMLLANLYSICKKWDSAAEARKLMKTKGVEKIRGCSWIEANGRVSRFISEDITHSESDEIFQMLGFVFVQSKLMGCAPEIDLLAFDTNIG